MHHAAQRNQAREHIVDSRCAELDRQRAKVRELEHAHAGCGEHRELGSVLAEGRKKLKEIEDEFGVGQDGVS